MPRPQAELSRPLWFSSRRSQIVIPDPQCRRTSEVIESTMAHDENYRPLGTCMLKDVQAPQHDLEMSCDTSLEPSFHREQRPLPTSASMETIASSHLSSASTLTQSIMAELEFENQLLEVENARMRLWNRSRRDSQLEATLPRSQVARGFFLPHKQEVTHLGEYSGPKTGFVKVVHTRERDFRCRMPSAFGFRMGMAVIRNGVHMKPEDEDEKSSELEAAPITASSGLNITVHGAEHVDFRFSQKQSILARLPNEILNLILEESLQSWLPQQVVYFKQTEYDGEVEAHHLRVPVLAHVCKRFRKYCAYFNIAPISPSFPVFFRATTDILYLSKEILEEADVYQMTGLEPFGRIQTVAVDFRYLETTEDIEQCILLIHTWLRSINELILVVPSLEYRHGVLPPAGLVLDRYREKQDVILNSHESISQSHGVFFNYLWVHWSETAVAIHDTMKRDDFWSNCNDAYQMSMPSVPRLRSKPKLPKITIRRAQSTSPERTGHAVALVEEQGNMSCFCSPSVLDELANPTWKHNNNEEWDLNENLMDF